MPFVAAPDGADLCCWLNACSLASATACVKEEMEKPGGKWKLVPGQPRAKQFPREEEKGGKGRGRTKKESRLHEKSTKEEGAQEENNAREEREERKRYEKERGQVFYAKALL